MRTLQSTDTVGKSAAGEICNPDRAARGSVVLKVAGPDTLVESLLSI